MSHESESKPGVWATLQRILDTLLATGQSRVELFAVELQEEKCRLVEAILWAAAVAAFGMMTLSVVTFALVVLFWENARVPALMALSVIYCIGTGLSWRALRLRLKGRTAFAETLAELKKDRSCFKTNN